MLCCALVCLCACFNATKKIRMEKTLLSKSSYLPVHCCEFACLCACMLVCFVVGLCACVLVLTHTEDQKEKKVFSKRMSV